MGKKVTIAAVKLLLLSISAETRASACALQLLISRLDYFADDQTRSVLQPERRVPLSKAMTATAGIQRTTRSSRVFAALSARRFKRRSCVVDFALPLPALERGGLTVQPRDCGSDLIRGVNQSPVQMDIALSYASNGVTVAGLQQMTIEERNRGINLADVG